MVHAGLVRCTLGLAATAIALSVAWPLRVSAQCAFNSPAKAKGVNTSLVRAYRPLGITPCYFPNATTSGGLAACAPPFSFSAFEFGDKGKCTVKTQHIVETTCALAGSSGPCSDVRLKARCAGILEPNSPTPINGLGWKLAVTYRITMDEDVGGPMTVIDLPFQLPFSAASGGKLSMSVLLNEACVEAGLCLELPPCANFELLTLRLLDPNGDTFATPGSSSR